MIVKWVVILEAIVLVLLLIMLLCQPNEKRAKVLSAFAQDCNGNVSARIELGSLFNSFELFCEDFKINK